MLQVKNLFNRNQIFRTKYSLINFILLIFITGISVFAFFTWKVYSSQYEEAIIKLRTESDKIEHSFSSTLDHTNYIMKIMIMQIIPNYEDLNYIFNVLNKYRTNPKIINILSWTIFSWLDAKQEKAVDAVYGIILPPADTIGMDYTEQCKSHPNKLFFGDPIMGSTSQRRIIPMGIGATDQDNNYIGMISIGIDLENLAQLLQGIVTESGMEFMLIDAKYNMIIKSNDQMKVYTDENEKLLDDKLIKIIDDNINFNKETSQTSYNISIVNNKKNYFLHKIDKYPFVIYMTFDNSFIKYKLWNALTSRLIEILVISFVAIISVILIYRHEVKLRTEAEISKTLAIKAYEAKKDFMAYTAHELRSPLGFIITGSEMMKSQLFGPLPDKYHDYITSIHNNSKELLEFINDLLTAMQAEEVGFKLELKEIELVDIIKRTIKLNQIKANENSILVNFDYPESMPSIKADPRRILQIFNNLLSNSIKYSPKSTQIYIKLEVAEEGDIIFIIEDEGFGINAEDIEIALAKYGTIINENSGKVESVGLGLPLTKELVEAHGAKFIIDSTPAIGTKIIIIFPQNMVV